MLHVPSKALLTTLIKRLLPILALTYLSVAILTISIMRLPEYIHSIFLRHIFLSYSYSDLLNSNPLTLQHEDEVTYRIRPFSKPILR